MKIRRLHSWRLSIQAALKVQANLRKRILLKNAFRTLRAVKRVAGVDCAIDPAEHRIYGGVIVYSFPGLQEIERRWGCRELRFPYIPGLLSFREAPVLLQVIGSLKYQPDIFIFDGQGIAHPRGIGIASHLGLFLDKPTIGCAKSRLCGFYQEPARRQGSFSPLLSEKGKSIGVVLRTRKSVRPVFISPGHKIDIPTAAAIMQRCLDGYRIPKPTREADHFVEAVKRREVST